MTHEEFWTMRPYIKMSENVAGITTQLKNVIGDAIRAGDMETAERLQNIKAKFDEVADLINEEFYSRLE